MGMPKSVNCALSRIMDICCGLSEFKPLFLSRVCRSCVRRGYFQDSFVHHFVQRQSSDRIRSLPPVINRGYYARHMIIKSLVLQFLEEFDTRVQVVVLGCGFDTLYFQLKSAGVLGSHVAAYVECDFPDVIQRKKYIVDTTEEMREIAQDGVYHMLGVDLRLGDVVMEQLAPYIDKNRPTLFLAECVLVYMEEEHSNALLRNISSLFSESMLVVYEQVNPHDAFGKQMMLNLRLRGCPLKGIIDSLDGQKERMQGCGWILSSSEYMLTLFNTCIPPNEIARINRIERLDEEEEWNLLLRHYCITWARNSSQHQLPSMSDIRSRISYNVD